MLTDYIQEVNHMRYFLFTSKAFECKNAEYMSADTNVMRIQRNDKRINISYPVAYI